MSTVLPTTAVAPRPTPRGPGAAQGDDFARALEAATTPDRADARQAEDRDRDVRDVGSRTADRAGDARTRASDARHRAADARGRSADAPGDAAAPDAELAGTTDDAAKPADGAGASSSTEQVPRPRLLPSGHRSPVPRRSRPPSRAPPPHRHPMPRRRGAARRRARRPGTRSPAPRPSRRRPVQPPPPPPDRSGGVGDPVEPDPAGGRPRRPGCGHASGRGAERHHRHPHRSRHVRHRPGGRDDHGRRLPTAAHLSDPRPRPPPCPAPRTGASRPRCRRPPRPGPRRGPRAAAGRSRACGDGPGAARRAARRAADGPDRTGGLSHGRHVLTVPSTRSTSARSGSSRTSAPTSVRVELVGSTDASREALRARSPTCARTSRPAA